MRVILLLLFLSLLLPGPLAAHGVKLLAVAEGEQIIGQGYFIGGGPAVNSPLSLRDQQDREVAGGQTDAQGKFKLPLPPDLQGEYRLLLLAGQGHQAERVIRLAGAEVSPPAPLLPGEAPARAPAQQADDALGQITRQLAELQEQIINLQLTLEQGQAVTWEKIMAGLGYILGLLGLAAYCRYRPKSSASEKG
jgi:nickel transport protein